MTEDDYEKLNAMVRAATPMVGGPVEYETIVQPTALRALLFAIITEIDALSKEIDK